MNRRTQLLLAALAGAITWLVASKGRAASFTATRFEPYSPKAKELLRFASVSAGLPKAWGDSPDLHYIMSKESGGWVGRPNYTFGAAASTKNQDQWPVIWKRLRSGEVWTKSTATGLGQLLTSNVRKFYPKGVDGIGDPVNEAVGFVKYIASRYGSPAVARSVYGKKGSYTHAITGAKRYKGFREGY